MPLVHRCRLIHFSCDGTPCAPRVVLLRLRRRQTGMDWTGYRAWREAMRRRHQAARRGERASCVPARMRARAPTVR